MKNYYSGSLILSLLLHVFLFLILLFSVILFPSSMSMKVPMAARSQQTIEKKDYVQAITVDQQQVDKAIANIKHQQAQQRAQKKAYVQRLERQARQAKATKKRAEEQAAALRREQHKQQQQEQAKLKAIKAKQQQAAKNLANLKAKQQQAKETALKEEIKRANQAHMNQQLAEEQKQLHEAMAQQMQSEIARYTALIRSSIYDKWNNPVGNEAQLSCILHITLAPGGLVQAVSLVKSSGNSAYDRAAQAAVYKASPLPVPSDQQLFAAMRDINLTMKP